MSSRFKKAKDIIGRFRSKLDTLFADSHSLRGELLTKALHYLHIYWKPLFAYLNDGSYSIDNLIVSSVLLQVNVRTFCFWELIG